MVAPTIHNGSVTGRAGRPEPLRLVADGDSRAWSALVEEQKARLFAVGRAFRLPAHETEDALQRTWLALLEHVGQIRDPECLGAWLTTTMRHECLRLLKSRREDLVDDWSRHESLHAGSEDPAGQLESLEEEREQRALAKELWKLVDELPVRQRHLLRTLFSGDDLSYAQISARTGLPIGAIGPTRQRALRRLRQLHEEDQALVVA